MKDATRAVIERLANQVADLKRELSEAKERIETVRKQAREDALETVKRCEQKSGNCVMVHSLMRHDVCNEENCSSFRALKTQGDAQ